MIGVCFLCETELDSEGTRVCSRIKPHSNVTYGSKIAELVENEITIVVTPDDYLCKK